MQSATTLSFKNDFREFNDVHSSWSSEDGPPAVALYVACADIPTKLLCILRPYPVLGLPWLSWISGREFCPNIWKEDSDFSLLFVYVTVPIQQYGHTIIVVRFPAGSRDSYIHLLFQAGSGAYRASHLLGTVYSRGAKSPGRGVDHSRPFYAQFKNEWSCTYTPPYIFMPCTGTTLHYYSRLKDGP